MLRHSVGEFAKYLLSFKYNLYCLSDGLKYLMLFSKHGRRAIFGFEAFRKSNFSKCLFLLYLLTTSESFTYLHSMFFLNTFDWIRMTSRCNTKYCAYDNGNNAEPHVILLSVDSKIKLKRSFIFYLY